MTELEKYIEASFGILEKEDLNKISKLFEYSELKKGDFLLESGKKCNKLSFVQSGLLRMFALVDGNEVTQWISTKGYFSTDLASFIYEESSRLSIQALVDTEVFSITKENYDKIGEIVSQWHSLEKQFLINCFITLEDRVFSHLSMSAEQRYKMFFESNKALFNEVPLQYIASMLGMTPETFSRIRKKQLL
ncbi:Crp/Fnr family transcriptional regulator [Brumimicrobium glaciale]|uniref:Crp/Fnr family transcriptional regulator n=1 Tax=Brumimicrobium glaciale TaxID=200475 RepID=A0A4Q4KNS2_9FLAO|nr:Crp/Fnr family transcriptional regulator [Brumimicrobium glaciale]RYM34084.1 Crp/Fnr family transcriptional regulator [Brumimicrobium glaciale]